MGCDDYFSAQGKLKLKGVDDSGLKKKKKKKKKDLERQMEASIRREMQDTTEASSGASTSAQMCTPAEQRFKERQRKMEAERILKKASKTHKEKVEEFNRHLDSLTEHFDIPKVSWTK
ncbi:protein FAM32A [Macrobrachium rosenbergii]|uniref:protein FAM32A n=1 Tax=Macrobrachium rosenbergii TaxID=79674 RepID=UPI0034D6E02C